MTWGNNSDQDLHVTTPKGCEIYFENAFCESGELDRDDLDGFGPENCFWNSSAPDGKYVVEVHDYEGVSGGTDFFININAPGVYRRFTGRTINGNKVIVVSFTKNGDKISF